MKGNPKKSSQQSFLYEGLSQTLNPRNPLYQLAGKIPWDFFEVEFTGAYINFGRPGKPIRLMIGILILKQMFDMSDEQIVRRWVENPYWQYFCGENEFQWEFPCDPSELTYFRKRIGENGVKKIFEVSIQIHGNRAMEGELIADTTAQEKNITYPTDIKLHLKVYKFCLMVAKKEGLKLRQSYRRTMPHLLWQTRYIKIASRRKEGIKAARMLKVRVGRILRDIERQMDDRLKEKYSEQLAIAFKILNQKKDDHNKIYSFHEPHVACIAKGKEHKKYEFGSKVSVLLTKNSGIIVGAMNFLGNPYDGKTLEPQLAQYKQIFGQEPKAVLVDEGYKGRQTIGETEVLRVHQKKKTGYSRWQWKQRFRRRSSIEPIIGHLKNDCRMARNYLKGTQGDSINLLLACAAFNFRKLMNQLAFYLQNLIMLIRFFIGPVIKSSPNFY